ncbi:DNA repair protein RecN [Pedobacter montanisoli]|uniref:DNA repair protein RecN n=1 Tax=Pedobacter montanisoli TaxID=2923277 RepID=A0ABS9ZW43_9SPHI|nr:DNA repair protein RecN [Pedobacter montanisoli]MCJ0742519.1 DNA repair protein RecN [Pedobacter montanisoli]
MLQKLSIRNYALIDSLDITFGNGLNIITGETGAGKSIILGALSLILGQRVESKYFYNQDKKCVIEGIFKVSNNELKELFEAEDLDFFDENILRREIAIDGKSRAFINDTPVNLNTLKYIGERLIAIHSQHATLEINSSDFQLLVLDSVAGQQDMLVNYKSQLKQLKSNEQTLKDLEDKALEASNKQDYEQFLFDELAAANLISDEQSQLEQELQKLTHAEGIKISLNNCLQLLDENEHNVIGQLKEAAHALRNVEQYDKEIETLSERLRSINIDLKDISFELAKIEENTLHNAELLQATQDRLNLIYTLQQKHKVSSVDELIDIQQQLETGLSESASYHEKIDVLKKTISKQQSDLFELAKKISDNRKKATVKVQEHITGVLHSLGMPNAKLLVDLKEEDQLRKDGINQIGFLFSANLGQAPAPVQKIASGGELSRLMLAIKSLLAKNTSLATLIFDEIDTGISGETALKVGLVMEKLSENMQIISITHLPQIAAKGKNHYFVYKSEQDQKTSTGIKKLDDSERVLAIAEMLSGKNPNEFALQNAKALLTT